MVGYCNNNYRYPICPGNIIGLPVIPSTPTFKLLTPFDDYPPSFSLSCVSTSFPPTTVAWILDNESIINDGDFQTSQVTNNNYAPLLCVLLLLLLIRCYWIHQQQHLIVF